ncbi:hypothetical protein KIW84_030380 [Lathyrus oleraceus]|uniref:Uncharacterized protein n=1 Tax=Pisum sativum TaxID=3888 RepID=A0A9D4XP65_PEA|nr:hypothetical protein KIW84_030380 [Pisum sativum]
MSKASYSTPNKSSKDQSAPTPSKARVTHANSKKHSSDVIIDATPIIVVPGCTPTKRGTKTPATKRAKPSNVSESSTPSLSFQIPPSEVRNVESIVVDKKPYTMTSLYLEPIKTLNVKPDIVTSAKGLFISNIVGSVGTFQKSASKTVSLDNPRDEKILGQSSLKDVINDTVDKSIHVSLSKTLVAYPGSGVVLDVAIFLAQPDHPTETTQQNSHGKSHNEFVPIKSPKNSQEDVSEAESVGDEKDDSDDGSMSIEGEKDLSDKEDKEESIGAKKYQTTDIANIDDLDSDDEPIGNKLALDETIKSCIEKKIKLESLIKDLSKEDADGNLDGDEEEGNEDEGNVADGDKDEETYGSRNKRSIDNNNIKLKWGKAKTKQ